MTGGPDWKMDEWERCQYFFHIFKEYKVSESSDECDMVLSAIE